VYEVIVSYITVIVLDTSIKYMWFEYNSFKSLIFNPIHFFARQRNESKKGDTGKPSATLSVGFPP